MIIDMGMHILHRTPGSHLLVQAVTPGLEARARSRPQPTSGVLQPGGASIYHCMVQQLQDDDLLQARAYGTYTRVKLNSPGSGRLEHQKAVCAYHILKNAL